MQLAKSIDIHWCGEPLDAPVALNPTSQIPNHGIFRKRGRTECQFGRIRCLFTEEGFRNSGKHPDLSHRYRHTTANWKWGFGTPFIYSGQLMNVPFGGELGDGPLPQTPTTLLYNTLAAGRSSVPPLNAPMLFSQVVTHATLTLKFRICCPDIMQAANAPSHFGNEHPTRTTR
ncbi:hypothetical protein BDD12DRAFT_397659 [Trichophaea hybrida]|nr:hypothetical protein BDD12DRAFT_397659 [Trichophaea hybrida]